MKTCKDCGFEIEDIDGHNYCNGCWELKVTGKANLDDGIKEDSIKEIVLSKELFDKIMPKLKSHIKDTCKYCGEKITRDNFGFLSMETTCCNSLLCLTEKVAEEAEDGNI